MPNNKKIAQAPSQKTWRAPKHLEGVSLCGPTENQNITKKELEQLKNKAYNLVKNELRKFQATISEHDKEQCSIIINHFSQFAFDSLPQKSITKLYQEKSAWYQRKSVAKQAQLQTTNELQWFAPELPEEVSEYRPETNQKIADDDLNDLRNKAYKLVYKELRKFPANFAAHNRRQHDHIRAHFARYAFEHFQGQNLTALYDQRIAIDSKKSRERQKSRPTNSEPWLPPKHLRLIKLDHKTTGTIPSDETLTEPKLKAFKLVKQSLEKYPVQSKGISAEQKNNNQKKRKDIYEYYDTHAFPDLPHIAVGKLARLHKNAKKRQYNASEKGAGAYRKTSREDKPDTQPKMKRAKRTRSRAITSTPASPEPNHEMEVSTESYDEAIAACQTKDIGAANPELINEITRHTNPFLHAPESANNNFSLPESTSEFEEQIGLKNHEITSAMKPTIQPLHGLETLPNEDFDLPIFPSEFEPEMDAQRPNIEATAVENQEATNKMYDSLQNEESDNSNMEAFLAPITSKIRS